MFSRRNAGCVWVASHVTMRGEEEHGKRHMAMRKPEWETHGVHAIVFYHWLGKRVVVVGGGGEGTIMLHCLECSCVIGMSNSLH